DVARAPAVSRVVPRDPDALKAARDATAAPVATFLGHSSPTRPRAEVDTRCRRIRRRRCRDAMEPDAPRAAWPGSSCRAARRVRSVRAVPTAGPEPAVPRSLPERAVPPMAGPEQAVLPPARERDAHPAAGGRLVRVVPTAAQAP